MPSPKSGERLSIKKKIWPLDFEFSSSSLFRTGWNTDYRRWIRLERGRNIAEGSQTSPTGLHSVKVDFFFTFKVQRLVCSVPLLYHSAWWTFGFSIYGLKIGENRFNDAHVLVADELVQNPSSFIQAFFSFFPKFWSRIKQTSFQKERNRELFQIPRFERQLFGAWIWNRLRNFTRPASKTLTNFLNNNWLTFNFHRTRCPGIPAEYHQSDIWLGYYD